MLSSELRVAVETFVAAVERSGALDAFLKAQVAFRGDPELRQIRKRFNERSGEFQTKQSKGTMSQEEIDELRALQNSLNTHPVTVQFIRARQELATGLEECNRTISQELGLDFASAAAPQSCCR